MTDPVAEPADRADLDADLSPTEAPAMWTERWACSPRSDVPLSWSWLSEPLRPRAYRVATKPPAGTCPHSCVGGRAEVVTLRAGRRSWGPVVMCRNCGRDRYLSVEIPGLPWVPLRSLIPSPQPLQQSRTHSARIAAAPLSSTDWYGMSVVNGATGKPRGRPRKPDNQVTRQALHLRRQRAQGLKIVRPTTAEELRCERRRLAGNALKYARGADRAVIQEWVAGASTKCPCSEERWRNDVDTASRP